MRYKFSLIQRLRNNIRPKGDYTLELSKKAKLVHCKVEMKGNNNKLIIEEGTVLRYVHLELLGDNSILHIGKNCIVGHGSYLSAKDGKSLYIGDDSMLSRNAKLMTSDGHEIYCNDKVINNAQNIFLDKHVWLSDNVTILKGVKIGKDSIVGINTTVTKNIPEYSIAVGNPAKVVKSGITWSQ